MSLTRKMLKAMGIEDEKIDQIIDAHVETTDALKLDMEKYKADAEKLPTVQTQLDDATAKLESAGNDGFEEKYNAVKSEFETFKSDQQAKAAHAMKEKAARSYYESKGITGKNLEIAMKGSVSEISEIEMDGDKIKSAAALDALVTDTFCGLIDSKLRIDTGAGLGGGAPRAEPSTLKEALQHKYKTEV